MTDALYKETLEAARSEMDDLLKEEIDLGSRLAIVRGRIEVLRKTIISIGDLLGEDREPETIGITDAIRGVLKARPDGFFSPTGVRSSLRTSSFPLDNYKNVLAVIHTTLKRLEDQNEVTTMTENSKTFYRWNESLIRDEDIPF
jgi:hypothetical protein